MKRFTLLMTVIALFSVIMQAETMQVTTSEMNADTQGSLLYVIANAPDATETIIEFNLADENLQYTGTGIGISNKILVFDGVNKQNGKNVTISGPNILFSLSNSSYITLNNLVIKDFKKIAMKIATGSTVEANHCQFINNFETESTTSNNGGVARISSSNAIFKNCFFKQNRGGGSYGGGVLCAYGASDLRVEGCTFAENMATHGGAIAVKGTGRDGATAVPKAYIVNSTFANNMADGRGGAIYFQTEATSGVFKPVVVNCTFVGNLTGDQGGALCLWSRAETTMEPTFINNLFAENYTNPWDLQNQVRNDIWAYYLEGALDINNNPLPVTVIPTCKNNLYVGSIDGFFKASDSNELIDFATNDIFKAIEKNPQDLGDTYYDHKTSVLEGNIPVAMISENSIANAKGITTFSGVEIPTTDQLGNQRPAIPSVGAVEYSVSTAIGDDIKIDSNKSRIKIWTLGNELFVNGLDGRAELTIFDMSGNQIYSNQVENNCSVQLNNMNKTVYIAKVQEGKSVSTIKFLVK